MFYRKNPPGRLNIPACAYRICKPFIYLGLPTFERKVQNPAHIKPKISWH